MFRAWQTWQQNQSGSVAMMNGFMLFMLVGAAGGAIDYSAATSKRAALQNAADASVLAAAGLPLADDATRIAHAKKMFLGSKFCESSTCSEPTVTVNNSTIVLAAAAQAKTTLLQVIGIDGINIGADSRAVPAKGKPVEIAMILDYSGSMNSANKYQDMATAATEFLDRAAIQPSGSMSVGVVPFSKYVLTPMEGKYLYDVSAGNNLMGQTVVGCVLNREHPHSTNVTPPSTANEGSLWPVFSYATGSDPNTTGYSSDSGKKPLEENFTITWEAYSYRIFYRDFIPTTGPERPTIELIPEKDGYAGFKIDGLKKFTVRWDSSFVDAPPPADIKNEYKISNFENFGGYGDSEKWTVGNDDGLPANFSADRLSEDLSGPCVEYATKKLWARPLSENFAQLKTAINAMRPIGWTNIALGLDLGWHMLTPAAPFTEGSSDDVQKVAILLTDGVQTVRAHGAGGVVSISAANANIAESCAAMKASGVEVFTIAFGIKNQYTRDMLKNCATDDPHYFEPSAGGDLDAVFDGIFNQIVQGEVRLAG